MPFTGKATYTAGADLPEIVEDVGDIVGIVSPFETPLLDRLGDARRPASSTIHEWIEDTLLPNTSSVNQTVFNPNPTDATDITVLHPDRFRPGDQVRPGTLREVMFVTAVNASVITVVRRYGGTTGGPLTNGMRLTVLGNAALEGDDAPDARATSRVRRRNFTQIFTSAVQVSGSMQATRRHAVADELDYQKQERLRELLRDLENCVLNGVAPPSNQQGSGTVRRTMNGIIQSIQTHQYQPGVNGFPAGGGTGSDLNEGVVNAALRLVWEQSSARIDTIVVNASQKRRINGFATPLRSFLPGDTRYRDLVSVYESDFGVCTILLSRWLAPDSVLLLDSTRIQVLPLSGRSFHYKPLAVTGDRDAGLLVGEYTVECMNENAHAIVRGLTI